MEELIDHMAHPFEFDKTMMREHYNVPLRITALNSAKSMSRQSTLKSIERSKDVLLNKIKSSCSNV